MERNGDAEKEGDVINEFLFFLFFVIFWPPDLSRLSLLMHPHPIGVAPYDVCKPSRLAHVSE